MAPTWPFVFYRLDSAEALARQVPQARVVKTLSQVGVGVLMADMSGFAHPPVIVYGLVTMRRPSGWSGRSSPTWASSCSTLDHCTGRGCSSPFAMVWIGSLAPMRGHGCPCPFAALPRGAGPMVYDVEQLLGLESRSDWTSSSLGLPLGRDSPTGRPMEQRSSPRERGSARVIAKFINTFAWQGKVFDAKKGSLRNRILPIGLNAIIAKVYKDKSWLDGEECIVLDYSDTSLIAPWIRDEIRAIAPGMYHGKVYWDDKRLMDFALEFGKEASFQAAAH